MTLRAASAALVGRVVTVLGDSSNRQLEVRVGGLSVGQEDLAAVGKAVRNGTIRVVTGRLGTGSAYDLRCNEIRLSDEQSGNALDVLILHEGIHASFDLRRQTVDAVDEEVVCYLAMAAFLRLRLESVLPYDRLLGDLVIGRRFGELERQLPRLRKGILGVMDGKGKAIYAHLNGTRTAYDGTSARPVTCGGR